MSAATDFLIRWTQRSLRVQPSVTFATCQPADQNLPPGRWTSGIASYGVGITGKVHRNAVGEPDGLQFPHVNVTFSDRISNPGASPQDFQRFAATSAEYYELVFLVDGNAVRLEVFLKNWNARWSALTTTMDGGGNQLVFLNVPPAGPMPLRAVMLVGFQASGIGGTL